MKFVVYVTLLMKRVLYFNMSVYKSKSPMERCGCKCLHVPTGWMLQFNLTDVQKNPYPTTTPQK